MYPAADPWRHLRIHTPARIALGRAGGSLPTEAWLEFASDHAAARDAVHAPFNAQQLAQEVQSLGAATLILSSQATDRRMHLVRPDWGRRLDALSAERLRESTAATTAGPDSWKYDLVVVVSDGLSALAAERQAPLVLAELIPHLQTAGWKLAPVIVVPFARVAIEDEIGGILNARLALILLGERPGLSSPDSLGAYLVHHPALGRTDADRNCVSNIRPAGLPPDCAAATIAELLSAARDRRLSGVRLKAAGTVSTQEPTQGITDGR